MFIYKKRLFLLTLIPYGEEERDPLFSIDIKALRAKKNKLT